MKTRLAIALSTACLLSLSCMKHEQPTADLGAARTEVDAVLTGIVQAFEKEDIGWFDANFAHDADLVVFGTDAAERWVGFQALHASMVKQFGAFDEAHLSAHDKVVHVAPTGTVAWYSRVWDWDIKTGGESVKLEGVRETGVLEKRNGRWVCVQAHFSMGVNGQAAAY